MADADYYRAEAKRCRELAARAVAGSAMATQWLRIAVEYETLAEALERVPMPAPMQQQRMQQQQSKASPTVLVRASPTGGYRWRVVLDGQTVGTGNGATEFAAREAASEVVKRIKETPPDSP